MAKSNRVSLAETERLLSLVVELAQLPATPFVRASHAAQGLKKLVGARGSTILHYRRSRSPGSRQAESFLPEDAFACIGGALDGLEDDSTARRLLAHYLASGEPADPQFQQILGHPSSLATLPRQILVDRQEWLKCAHFADMRRLLGIDDSVSTKFATNDPDIVLTICLHGAVGDRIFTPRQWKMIEMFFRVARPLLIADTAPATDPLTQFDPRVRLLPPRLRQTLERLLQGDSIKQAAHAMGLSKYTVNDYAKELHARLGVNSRAELLAKFLPHGE